MYTLALVYSRKGNIREVEQTSFCAMELRSCLLGMDHHNTQVGIYYAVIIVLDQGEFPKSEELLWEIYETKKTTLGLSIQVLEGCKFYIAIAFID